MDGRDLDAKGDEDHVKFRKDECGGWLGEILFFKSKKKKKSTYTSPHPVSCPSHLKGRIEIRRHPGKEEAERLPGQLPEATRTSREKEDARASAARNRSWNGGGA
jgi:hypothetical protein